MTALPVAIASASHSHSHPPGSPAHTAHQVMSQEQRWHRLGAAGGHWLVCAALWMACLPSCAQTAPAPAPAAAAAAADPAEQCKKDVLQFERAIGTVRQLQGNQAAADLKEKLLPAATERQLLNTEGYCGLSRYLNDKKLLR